MFAQHTGTKALVATRMNLFLAAILHAYPELTGFVPKSRTLSVRVREEDGAAGAAEVDSGSDD